MDRIAALQFFARVVESGSFSQAARELGVGQPAVSKRVAALERRLGAQLLRRTSRGLRPTLAGAELYDAARGILRALDDAESRVADGHERPSGAVRVAAPPILSSKMIVPELPEFFAHHPDVSIEFVVSERHADLVQEGLDLAIRVGHLDNSGLVARKIGRVQLVTVASPDYLKSRGVPSKPADLNNHQLLANRHLGAIGDWHFADDECPVVTPKAVRFSCNIPADMHAAALAGIGIVQSARAVFDAELRSGEVVEVLSDFVTEPVPIHAVYGSSRVPRRVRVVSDFIAQCVDRQESLRLR
jgi:LysR family transcriptional regulator, regulator for bpeEF and oprC